VYPRSEPLADALRPNVDADKVCESFSRKLMLCRQRRGETVEAVSTHERPRFDES
jgi:hypothetical protein